MPENPNPQGKGLVPILEDLERQRVAGVLPPKKIDQVEMELFTSLFVLRSEFKFNPVPEKPYWLYQKEGHFKLLMIAPHEWQRPYPGRFIGKCVLHQDRTWTLELDHAMTHDKAFMDYIESERARLHQSLEEAESVEEALPVYESSFAFYARILAFTLGKSLDASMQLSGIKGLTYRQAKGLLTRETADHAE